MQELQMATKIPVRALGQMMSTLVVQEIKLWLNLAQMKEADQVSFFRLPHLPGRPLL